MAAQKAQVQQGNVAAAGNSTLRSGSSVSASNPASTTTSSADGSIVADKQTVSAAERDVRIANSGMGDDSATIKQKYANRGLAK